MNIDEKKIVNIIPRAMGREKFSKKPHGRMNCIININRDFEMKFYGLVSEVKEYSDPQYYIDISII